MTVTAHDAPAGPAAPAAPAAPRNGAAGRGSPLGLLVTPLLLAAACLALYLHINGQELDSIETRALDREVITRQLLEHLRLVGASTGLVIALAIPLGVLLTRPGPARFAWPVLALANMGQAVPSIGVLVLLAVTVGIGFQQALIALVLVSVLPVLRNTMVGLRGVDRSLIDAARGMGLTRTAVLLRVELPLAVPVMMAGLRIALILNVGSATLATYTNAGGLGGLIDTGISLNRTPVLLTGCVLTAVLALACDWLIGLAERTLRPRGL
ncbi:ABC transporter permease [Streptomyces sp. DSM 44917]|uniref:ABC transporter permease n=1 Tax=Streptomyces boetiae TaxID=3075541 RepID=A0ABU2LD95_9ACTN|nr:ABC transporter permease [Streptomyces sp. DSM 44917]MDT0309554.1 ABC transporter permease [Streptomyces sp. DSM 44917]